VAGRVDPVPPWSGARVRNTGHRPGASGTIKGDDVQLTFPSRRVLGVLAAGTVGLSTALLGVTGVAQATTFAGPAAPTNIDVYGDDGQLDVYFQPAIPADDNTDNSQYADSWSYKLTSTGGAGNTSGFQTFVPQDQNGLKYVEFDGLTNGTEYTLVLRATGLDDNDVNVDGAESAPVTGTPFKAIGAPGTPTVVVGPSSLKVSWTAPSTTGTYPFVKYGVKIPVSHGQSGGPEIVCETTALQCTLPVKAGVGYPVWVVAVDDHGNEGVESDEVDSGVVPNPAAPATVPTKNGDLTLPAGATSTVVPGKTVTVSGSGYAPNTTITLAIYSTPQVLTTTVTDASGNFTATVTVPAGLEAGNHTLVASGVDTSGNVRYVNLAVTVSGSGKATLAYTGADVVPPALGGLAAVALGTGLILVRRRATRSAA
jgi:titin